MDELPIQRGVRQGRILSPLLFNIYSGFIFDKPLKDRNNDKNINGVSSIKLRCADVVAIIADIPDNQ